MAKNQFLDRILSYVSSFPSVVTARSGLEFNNTCGDVGTHYRGIGKTGSAEVAPENLIGIREEGGIGRAEGSAAAGRMNLVD